MKKFLPFAYMCVAALPLQAQKSYSNRAGDVDIFMGVDFNYRDITHERIYDFLIYLTPGVKWNMGHQWQAAAQVLVPVVNDYGGYYNRTRLNMAVLSKEVNLRSRLFLKGSAGVFSNERYGFDLKAFYPLTSWLAIEAQGGVLGFFSMARGWNYSSMENLSGTLGATLYLKEWNTQMRASAGKFIYGDYGVIAEGMRHFKHSSVGVYFQYSDKGGRNGGFKVVMMIPPYSRKHRKVNFRPASNFRLTYNMEALPYANKMYKTDPEENEREGNFNRDSLKWGTNNMNSDIYYH